MLNGGEMRDGQFVITGLYEARGESSGDCGFVVATVQHSKHDSPRSGMETFVKPQSRLRCAFRRRALRTSPYRRPSKSCVYDMSASAFVGRLALMIQGWSPLHACSFVLHQLISGRDLIPYQGPSCLARGQGLQG